MSPLETSKAINQ